MENRPPLTQILAAAFAAKLQSKRGKYHPCRHVLLNWIKRLHDTESSLHIVDLWLHALDGLHISGDLNEWLSLSK